MEVLPPQVADASLAPAGLLIGEDSGTGGRGQTHPLSSALCSTCGSFTWGYLVLWCSSSSPEKKNIAATPSQWKQKENERHEVLRSCHGSTAVLCRAGLITVSSRFVHAAVRTPHSISISNLMETIWVYSSVIWWLLFAALVAQRSLISGGDLFFEVSTRHKTSDIQRFRSQTDEDARNPARDLEEEKLEEQWWGLSCGPKLSVLLSTKPWGPDSHLLHPVPVPLTSRVGRPVSHFWRHQPTTG